MLDTLRNSTNTWIVRILIGLLVVSFGVWGITDVFSYRQDDTIVEVDDNEVGLMQYRLLAVQELAALSEEEGERIDFEQAREKGADQDILERLINRALLDNAARRMGLRIGEEQVADVILEAPEFRNAFGEFDRGLFRQILRVNGMNEALYVETQTKAMQRQQILAAVRAGAQVPYRLAELLHLYVGEERIASYLLFSDDAIDEVETPDEAETRAFYDEEPERFDIPERRSFRILQLEPRQLMDNVEIPDATVLEEYEARKEEFDRPERRRVERLSFPSRAEAEEALQRLEEGADFLALAAERGFGPEDEDQGLLARGEFDSEAVEEAVFALREVDDVSGVIEGPLGSAILRLREVAPGEESNFEDIEERIVWDLKYAQAAEEVFAIHDLIEDGLAGGRPLPEIAEELELEIVALERIGRNSRNAEGERPENMPFINGLMREVFATEPGEDSVAGETPSSGFYWFETTEVHPGYTPDFEEAREKVVERWQGDMRRERMEAYAEELEAQLEEGSVSLQQLAERLPPRRGEEGEEDIAVTVETTDPIVRRKRGNQFRRAAHAELFEMDEREAAWSWGRGTDRDFIFLFQLDEVRPAVATEEREEIDELLGELTGGMRNDIANLLMAELRTAADIDINEDLLASPLVDPYYNPYQGGY